MPRPVIVFRVGDRHFALPGETVSRVLPLPRLRRPPQCPPALAGLLDLGGRLVAVVHCGVLLDIEAPPPGLYSHLLLLRGGAGELALLVERATAVLRPREVIEAPPDESFRGLVAGQFEHDGATVHLLSPPALIEDRERRRLAAFAAAEAARAALLAEAEA